MKTKTIRTLNWEMDPTTKQQVWVERERMRYSLDDEDRLRLVSEIIEGKTTPEQVREKYKISSIQSVYSWIGKYVSLQNSVSSQSQREEDMANKSKEDQIKELKAALKQAQKKAELEELRAKAYDKMIDLAEERFNIPIRKKSGTKQ